MFTVFIYFSTNSISSSNCSSIISCYSTCHSLQALISAWLSQLHAIFWFLYLIHTDPHSRIHINTKQQNARLHCEIYHMSMNPISSEDASGAHWHVNGNYRYLIDCRCQRRWHRSRASHSAHQITATSVPRWNCCSHHSWLLCGLHAEVPFLSSASLTFITYLCKKAV